ncbi:MAG: acetylornithine deacetylase [Myxococcales bacterium]|nr:acetylornithine deacetylase [Myxococcales bacterium]
METYVHDVARSLIESDTVSHKSNRQAAAELADDLLRFGFDVRLQEVEDGDSGKVNLVASAGPPVSGGLLISGHLDVVPYQDQPGWTQDPLALTLDGDHVYGRGTSDMKVFIAHCMDAARRLEPSRLKRPLALVFTCDEEVGCLGARKFVDEVDTVLDSVPLPSLAWIGEPTDNRIFRAHKGAVTFGVTVEGVGGHSSLPASGVNAISAAGGVLAIIGELEQSMRDATSGACGELFAEAPYSTLNIAAIHGGTALNMIPERCDIVVNYRPLPDEDPLQPYNTLQSKLRELETAHRGRSARYSLSEPFVVPGLLSPAGTSLEKTLRDVLRAERAAGAPYGTDGGVFAQCGLTTIVCGPGSIAQAHQPNESISRQAFESGGAVVSEVIGRFCTEPAHE